MKDIDVFRTAALVQGTHISVDIELFIEIRRARAKESFWVPEEICRTAGEDKCV